MALERIKLHVLYIYEGPPAGIFPDEEKQPMVKHIVLFKLKERAEGASRADNARLAKARLEELRGKIPGLLELAVGLNPDPNDPSYDLALDSTFESRAALAAYQVHPEHQAVADFIGRVRESRTVADYHVPEAAVRSAADLAGADPSRGGEASAPGASGRPWTQGDVLGTSRAFQESRVLLTGAELDLFTLLAPAPMTAPDIAGRIGADLPALTIELDALAAMGLLVKRDGAYRTRPSAAELLASGRPGSVLPMVLHNANLWGRWTGLTRAVAGPQAEKKIDEASLLSFIGGMHVIAAPLAARIVELVKPGASRRLLDVGGASGTYTLAFLAASPEMRATLFDRAPVVELARTRLRDAGVLDRVTLVPGDFYSDALPGGHDLVFVSAIIHQNNPVQNLDLFRKAFAALEPGGRIVVRDHVLSPDRTAPLSGALFAVNMLAVYSGGNSYTLAEIADALTQAGFGQVRQIHPDAHMDGLVEAYKPR
jgi:SAM-dependent methyltransferase